MSIATYLFVVSRIINISKPSPNHHTISINFLNFPIFCLNFHYISPLPPPQPVQKTGPSLKQLGPTPESHHTCQQSIFLNRFLKIGSQFYLSFTTNLTDGLHLTEQGGGRQGQGRRFMTTQLATLRHSPGPSKLCIMQTDANLLSYQLDLFSYLNFPLTPLMSGMFNKELGLKATK